LAALKVREANAAGAIVTIEVHYAIGILRGARGTSREWVAGSFARAFVTGSIQHGTVVLLHLPELIDEVPMLAVQ
jgi:hypothetical protein